MPLSLSETSSDDAGNVTGSPGPLLSVRHLSVLVEERCCILEDISFDVQAGEVLSIIGPNGAGKSTLLKSMLGLIPLSAGEIQLAGRAIEDTPGRERARLMGYVPQVSPASLYSTVEDFILMGRYPYLSFFASPGKNDWEAVVMALELTGTHALRQRPLYTLSGGERQKVMIAGALAQQPRLLLLDEPATYLDPRNELELQELLLSINREAGTAIMLVTHNLNHALRTSHRLLGLRLGRMAFSGAPGALLESTALQDIFGIRFRQVPVDGEEVPLLMPEATSR